MTKMNKLALAYALVLICTTCILAIMSYSCFAQNSPREVEKWVETLSHKKEKVTKLHFHFHRVADKTAAVVAQAANMTTPNPTAFGLLVIKDDPLTVGPEPTSKRIGYAQGMSASAAVEDVYLSEAFTFLFTDGAYNGSTLAVLGSNPILQSYREMPIVGGTGVFRLARGLVSYQTGFYNTTSGDAAVEVNLVVFHF